MSSSLRAVLPFARRLAGCMAVAVGLAAASPAFAVDHTQIVPRGHEGGHPGDHGHGHGHDHDRGGRRGPAGGLYFGAPAYVAPPPVYYGGDYPYAYGGYPYAPMPLGGIYISADGYYCRDYQTAAGIETACQQPDGVWRFVN